MWRERAECAKPEYDPDMWTSTSGRKKAQAKQICRTMCPVAEQCLRYALEYERISKESLRGIHGGTDETQRRTLRLRQKELAS